MKLKQYLLLFSVAAAIATSLLSNYYYKAYREQKRLAGTFETTITNLNQEIKQTKIHLNDSLEVYQAEVKSLMVSRDNINAKYKNLLKASELRPKDVNSVTDITTQVKSTDTVTALVDTFGGIRVKLYDKWARINVEVMPDRRTVIDYSFRDSVSVIAVQKKHSILFGLIKWKSLESTRVVSYNPKAQIVGLQTMEVVK